MTSVDPGMYELQEFERSRRDQVFNPILSSEISSKMIRRRVKSGVANEGQMGSIRKALEDGRLRPVAMRLPSTAERRRPHNDCSTRTKLCVLTFACLLVMMLCYALWRIRNIEEPSESSDYEYRILADADGDGDVDAYDNNNVDVT